MAQFRKLEFYVSAETYAQLEEMAREGGKTVQETADALLEAIAEDDRAANGAREEA